MGGGRRFTTMAAAVAVMIAVTGCAAEGVRPVGGSRDCQGSPPTPATVDLAEPLGQRTVLDGGTEPAAPPSAPR